MDLLHNKTTSLAVIALPIWGKPKNQYFMKKTFLRSSVIVLLAIASLTGCKKDKSEAVVPTQENLAGSYKLTAFTVKLNANAETDGMANFLTCEKDDLYKLNADLSFNYLDAGTACDPVGDDNGSWILVSPTKISFYGYEFDIISFNGNTLVGSQTTVDGDNTYTVKGTFTKQ